MTHPQLLKAIVKTFLIPACVLTSIGAFAQGKKPEVIRNYVVIPLCSEHKQYPPVMVCVRLGVVGHEVSEAPPSKMTDERKLFYTLWSPTAPLGQPTEANDVRLTKVKKLEGPLQVPASVADLVHQIEYQKKASSQTLILQPLFQTGYGLVSHAWITEDHLNVLLVPSTFSAEQRSQFILRDFLGFMIVEGEKPKTVDKAIENFFESSGTPVVKLHYYDAYNMLIIQANDHFLDDAEPLFSS